jgi:hypothetical protein
MGCNLVCYVCIEIREDKLSIEIKGEWYVANRGATAAEEVKIRVYYFYYVKRIHFMSSQCTKSLTYCQRSFFLTLGLWCFYTFGLIVKDSFFFLRKKDTFEFITIRFGLFKNKIKYI